MFAVIGGMLCKSDKPFIIIPAAVPWTADLPAVCPLLRIICSRMTERERFYSLYQTRRVSRAEPNKNLTQKRENSLA